MNWHDLSVVLAVAREGSFTGAAKVLKVAHTTIGRRISDIEEKIDAKLFMRTKSTCIPTDNCQEIIASIERMETEAISIGAHFQNYDEAPRGMVKIATMPWIIQYIIAPALPSLTAAYPGIEIQFISGARARSITAHETDISLRFELPPRDKEKSLELAQIPYSIYATDVEAPEKLKWATYWVDSLNSHPNRWLQTKKGVTEEIGFRANDAALVMAVIRSGVARGLIPDLLGDKETNLVRLSGPAPEIVRTMYLIYHPDMRYLARINAVISWLEGVFKEAVLN